MILRHAIDSCSLRRRGAGLPALPLQQRRGEQPPAASTADAATGLADTQLVLKFACFGFKDRDCLLTLGSGGTATFSAGMVSDGPGEWRVVAGDPEDGENPRDAYLEFSQPVTEVYSELYNVPSRRGLLARPRREQGRAFSYCGRRRDLGVVGYLEN